MHEDTLDFPEKSEIIAGRGRFDPLKERRAENGLEKFREKFVIADLFPLTSQLSHERKTHEIPHEKSS